MAIVFVTGATGVVGVPLVQRLLASGHSVRALLRRPTVGLPTAVEPVMGDLADEAALARGADGADAVVHLAAMLHINAPGPELEATYWAVNVDGTRRLVEASASVPRVVFASTISVYGPSAGRAPWTEADVPQPDTLYGRSKLEAERVIRSHPGGVVLRLAAVYGAGMKGNYPALLRLLSHGVRWLPGDGRNRRTLVHVEDAVEAVRLSVDSVSPGTYNVTDGDIHTFDEVVRSLQAASGRPPGVRYVPAAPVRAALRLPARLAASLGRSFPGPHLVDKLTEDVAVSGDALPSVSPYRPARTTLAHGWTT